MKKYILYLLIPVFVTSTFFGCFKKREYKANEVYQSYASYMDKYIESGKNNIFKYNVNPKTSEADEEKNLNEPNAVFEKIMYITYNDASLQKAVFEEGVNVIGDGGGEESKNITDLIKAFTQLKTVYQKLLSLSFNYYANWSKNFYTHAQDLVPSTEIANLNALLRNLERQTDSFIVAKKQLEEKIAFAGVKSPLNLSNIKSFSYDYTLLLDNVFDFVNYFQHLHKTYIFKTELFTIENIDRLIDETVLKIAYAVYLDSVKMYVESNNINIIHLAPDKEGNKPANLLTSDIWKKLINTNNKFNPVVINTKADKQILGVSIEDIAINGVVNNDELQITEKHYQDAKDVVNNLFIINKMFTQEFDIYKKIFNGLSDKDKKDYNINRGTSLVISPVKEELTLSQESKFIIMGDLATSKLPALFNALQEIMVF